MPAGSSQGRRSPRGDGAPVDEETRLSSEKLGGVEFARHRITLAHLPPVLAEPLVEGESDDGRGLRALLTGSDKVQRAPRRGPFRFANHYGPDRVRHPRVGEIEASPSGEPPPIGRPLSGVRMYVVDEPEWAPPGVVGEELLIGALGVARLRGGRSNT